MNRTNPLYILGCACYHFCLPFFQAVNQKVRTAWSRIHFALAPKPPLSPQRVNWNNQAFLDLAFRQACLNNLSLPQKAFALQFALTRTSQEVLERPEVQELRNRDIDLYRRLFKNMEEDSEQVVLEEVSDIGWVESEQEVSPESLFDRLFENMEEDDGYETARSSVYESITSEQVVLEEVSDIEWVESEQEVSPESLFDRLFEQVTDEQRSALDYILKTTAGLNGWSLINPKKVLSELEVLEAEGAKICAIHPLVLLTLIFMDSERRKWARQIRFELGSVKWKGLETFKVDGFSTRIIAALESSELEPYVEAFTQRVGISSAVLKEKQWEQLFDKLFEVKL